MGTSIFSATKTTCNAKWQENNTSKKINDYAHIHCPSSTDQGFGYTWIFFVFHPGPIKKNLISQSIQVHPSVRLLIDWASALMICPPTNRPRDILTQAKHLPNKPSSVTIYYSDILSQSGRIARPPQIVTFWPSNFGRFVTVWQTDSL